MRRERPAVVEREAFEEELGGYWYPGPFLGPLCWPQMAETPMRGENVLGWVYDGWAVTRGGQVMAGWYDSGEAVWE